MRIAALLAATFLAASAVPAAAQTDSGTPAFRVPLGGGSSPTSGPAVYAWMETVGTCSNTCGDGNRATTYQCQDVGSFDFAGAGYGAPEPDSSCTTPKPADKSTTCTNYSGCSYDWVKPAVEVTRIAKPNPPSGNYPVGAVDDCSHAKRVFEPYCQRAGSPAVTMAKGDHAFCKNDTPDYDEVAAGSPDALGYDRTTDVSTGCVAGARDHEWKFDRVATPASTCSASPVRTNSFQCVQKYNGAVKSDASCSGVTPPSPGVTENLPADYSECSFAWEPGSWGSYSSTCSDSATRTRSVVCRRSDGTAVDDSSCSGTKPDTTETGSNTVGCGYEWGTPSAWTYDSQCSSSTVRRRTVACTRSDGRTVADSFCSSSTKPTTAETTSNYSSCSYTPRNVGQSSCQNGQYEVYWDCTRSDGQTGYPASYCGKNNPEYVACQSYTYSPRDMGRSACQNGQQDQYWDCTRSDGQTGYPASYCGKSNPEVVSCSSAPTYTYTPADRGRSACSNGSQQQYWDCTRSDGQTGFPANMCGKTNPENVSCTPTYTYTPVNRGEGLCENNQKPVYWDCTRSDGATGYPASYCGKSNPEYVGCTSAPTYTYTPAYRGETVCSNNQKQVYWDCTRNDGQTGYPASYCGKTNPETQSCSTPVTYTPRKTGESQCSNGQKQIYWDCQGSDGSTAPASSCGKTNPETVGCTMPVSYSWNYDGWSGYSSSCSDSAVRTRNVWCQGTDGSRPGDAPCGGGKPASSETAGVYSGCTYRSEDNGTMTACSNGQQSVPLRCVRSDGVTVANSNCGTGETRTQSCQMPVTCSAPTNGRVCSGGAQIWAITPDMGVDYETYYAQCLNGSQSRCVAADTKEYVAGYVEGAIRCYSGGTATGGGTRSFYSDGDNSFGKIDESRSKSCS